jgi:hypothetical protein
MQARQHASAPDQPHHPADTLHPLNASRDFFLILMLFVAFRAMALLAFRPGGQVLDFSDFYWYREFAQLTRQGYVPYVNLWTTYPPLFPFLMIGLWRVSSLLPPWEFPNLWFSLLLGGTFLLFETGNLVLIYAIAGRLGNRRTAIRSAWFYTALFTPVYTLTGWFESYPLFFFLLSLYLLLRRRPLWSALTTGVGFMIKLIPLILLPIGAQIPNTKWQIPNIKYQISNTKYQIPNGKRRVKIRLPNLSFDICNLKFDICHLIFYFGTFVLTVLVIGLPFYLLNPRLVWGPLVISGAREPWETVWALLEGKFGYGIIPLDMRNVIWDSATGHGSSLPWLWITLAFGLIYLFAYTRPFDWKVPRNVVAFTGFTLVLFVLYSKGYSPQWLGWALVFIALLLPNLRGAFYAVVTGLLNLVEANVFLTILPDEGWLLVVTVGLRTLILAALAVEFMLIVQPHWLTPTVRRVRRWGLIGLASLLVVGGVPAGARFVPAYFDARYQLSPYQATIETLRTARTHSTESAALILNSYDHETYDWLYPYLRRDFTFYMLDDYAPPGESMTARTIARLERIAADHRDWWLFDSEPTTQSPSEAVAADWLAIHGTLLDVHESDGGRLYHFIVER